jgi:hypothetical protein
MKPQVFFCKVCGEKFYTDDIVCAKHQSERDRLEKEWEENHPGFKKIQEEALARIESISQRTARKNKRSPVLGDGIK